MSARVGHPAASGSGTDVAHVRDRYAVLDVPDVWFQPGVETIPISSQEGEAGRVERLVTVDLRPGLRGRDRYTVVLNGFDLQSESDPDKLIAFYLGLSDHRPIAGDRLRFRIDGMLNVDCDSLECDGYPTTWDVLLTVLNPALGATAIGGRLAGKFNVATDYRLRVHYLVIAGDAESLNVVDGELVDVDYTWNKKLEVQRSATGQPSIVFEGPGVWESSEAQSTVAMRHFMMNIDRDKGLLQSDDAMHLLQWDTSIDNISCDGRKVTGDATLFFKNWAEGMKNAHPPASLTAVKDAGRARLALTPQLLQFRNARTVAHDDRTGSFRWEGSGFLRPNRGDDIDSPEARNESRIDIAP